MTNADKQTCLAMLQGKPINALLQTSDKSFKRDKITGKGVAIKNQVMIIIEDIIAHKLNANALKVLLLTIQKLTRNITYGVTLTDEELDKRRSIVFDLKEYMELCGITDKKYARDCLWAGIDTLIHTSLDWNEALPHVSGKTLLNYTGHVFDDKLALEQLDRKNTIKNGRVYVNVGRVLTSYLSQAYIMPLALTPLLAVNANVNPHSLYLGYRLMSHYNMNYGKSNANRISVGTLIDACPNLPKDVTNRRERQLLIEPFEKDLNALTEGENKIISEWYYLDSSGKPLSDDALRDMSYKHWITYTVCFQTLENYPVREIQTSSKEKRKEMVTERKKKAT